MTHAHTHDDNSYYTEQLCTIGICGLFGGILVMLYVRSGPDDSMLRFLLVDQFHPWVLGAGIAVLVLVAIRSVTLWVSVGKAAPAHSHTHDDDHHHHEHGPDCGHEHAVKAAVSGHAHGGAPLMALTVAPHDHSHGGDGHSHGGDGHSHGGDGHGHDHSHTWAPIRYVVLLLAPVLYFLDIPNKAISGTHIEVDESVRKVADRGTATGLRFSELDNAAYSPYLRQEYEGKTATLKGEYLGSGNDNAFTLVRLKKNCCISDAIRLNAVILIDDSKMPKDAPPEDKRISPSKLQGKWVEVTGQIQFRKRRDKDAYIPILLVQPTKERPVGKWIETCPADYRQTDL